MARNNNAFAKRMRDLQKKQKTEDKIARRKKRKADLKGTEAGGDRSSGGQ